MLLFDLLKVYIERLWKNSLIAFFDSFVCLLNICLGQQETVWKLKCEKIHCEIVCTHKGVILLDHYL